jgi:hypothetical protein
MKKYKLKEEVKKYVAIRFQSYEATEKEWGTNGFTIGALEEVEDRIEVYLHDDIEYNWAISLHGRSFTEQEREDIEKFLNVFGSWEKMSEITQEWMHKTLIKESEVIFKEFLKEEGYDK